MALDPRTQLNRYARQTWSTENGLPQNSAHVLLQTPDGFLWIGTEAGLARFDGYQFKVYDRNSVSALPGDDIHCLLADRMGGLWVGTASGLSILKNGGARTFTSADGLPAGAVKELEETRDGRVWVLAVDGLSSASGNRQGDVVFSRLEGLNGLSVLSILTDGGDGLWIATAQGLRHLTHGQVQSGPVELTASRIDALAPVEGDKTGVAVASPRGIFRLEKGIWRAVADPTLLPPEGVRSLLATRQGVWAASRNSLTLFQAGRPLVFTAGGGLPGTQITDLFEDQHGTVWIGTNGGLARYLDGKMEQVGETGDAVLSLFEDRDGDLWEGTETEGVRVLRDRAFQVLDPAIQSSEAAPTSVVQAGDGRVWIGTSGAGVFEANGRPEGTKAYTQTNGLASDTVLALASGGQSKHDLWVGTSNGLNLFHNGKWRSFTSADGLADELVRSLLPTRDGSLFIGTSHGLTRLRDRRATTMTTDQETYQGLGSNLIGPMIETQDGDIWIGTFGGLSRLHSGTFRNFTTADGLPGNTITALATSAKGDIWVGTKGQGLARWDGMRFSRFAASRSIPDEIYSLMDDNAGSLWMTSEHGIFRVSIRDLDQSLADPANTPKNGVPVVSYGTADGLPSVDTVAIGYPLAWRLNDGRLCFVTRRGVVVADPARTRQSESPPPMVLEEVTVDDRIVTPQELASMAPGPLHFSFTFAAINLSIPQRVEYRYSLDGLDQEWVYAGTRRVAYYTNIPHGRYRFRVSARNELGAWSAPAEVWFELRPHFYQTLWFRVLLVLAAVLLGLGIYAMRVRTLRGRFNLVSAERNRIAREIHDTLAQSFVAVSMRLEVMGQLLKSNDGVERCREQLNQTRALVRESLAEARRSIWDLRSEGAEAQALPARLARVVQDATATVKGTRLETTGTFRPLDRQLEDELFRIAQETVANAIRHAAAKSIRLRLCYELEALRLEVIDDGCGFDPSLAPTQGTGHFGLTGIRERARLVGAEVMLRSVPGEGTRVQVVVPLVRSGIAGKR
jgi:signal transduction histidine kinase/ligand-binding sensor domain-containing protein